MKKIICLLLLLVFMTACDRKNSNIDYETEPPMNIIGGITSVPQNSSYKKDSKVPIATSSVTSAVFPIEFENENRNNSKISYTDNKVLFPNGSIVRTYYANHFTPQTLHEVPDLNQSELMEVIRLLETNDWMTFHEAQKLNELKDGNAIGTRLFIEYVTAHGEAFTLEICPASNGVTLIYINDTSDSDIARFQWEDINHTIIAVYSNELTDLVKKGTHWRNVNLDKLDNIETAWVHTALKNNDQGFALSQTEIKGLIATIKKNEPKQIDEMYYQANIDMRTQDGDIIHLATSVYGTYIAVEGVVYEIDADAQYGEKFAAMIEDRFWPKQSISPVQESEE